MGGCGGAITEGVTITDSTTAAVEACGNEVYFSHENCHRLNAVSMCVGGCGCVCVCLSVFAFACVCTLK